MIHICCLRSIRVPYHPDFQLQTTSPHSFAQFPFQDIFSFEFTKEYSPAHLIHSLKFFTRLDSVAIRCDDACESWTDYVSIPGLKEARVLITRDANALPTTSFPLPLPDVSSHSLTTLALYNHGRQKEVSRLIEHCIQHCQFPKLCSLTVEGWESHCATLFQFIHAHPTLMEVNVLTRRAVRPESLLKLVDGTGTWMLPTRATGARRVCQIEYHDYDRQDPFPPDFIPPDDRNEVILCSDFAFVREPVSLGSTRWRSPAGSQQRRYKCKSLAINRLRTFTIFSRRPLEPLDLTAFMEAISNHSPELEELRLSHAGRCDMSFGALMVSSDVVSSCHDQVLTQSVFQNGLAAGLENDESKIKKLAVHSSALERYWDEDDTAYFQDDRPNNWVMLDSAHPPYGVHLHGVQRQLFSLDDLIGDKEDMDDEIETHLARVFFAVRNFLSLGPDAQVDQEDKTLLMRVWGAKHKERVGQYVTALGDSLPLLEAFDWYVMSEELTKVPSASEPSYMALLWHWEFERDGEGWVTSVSGMLSYVDGPCSDYPPKFYILVGQELERAQKLGKTSLNRYYEQPEYDILLLPVAPAPYYPFGSP